MSRKFIPNHVKALYSNRARGFKQEKRQQMRVVMKAIDELSFGIAFSPGYNDFELMRKASQKLQRSLSLKVFGR